ncbi:MAG: hypothetical protein U1D30_12810 [Planctomycetota bacterium]
MNSLVSVLLGCLWVVANEGANVATPASESWIRVEEGGFSLKDSVADQWFIRKGAAFGELNQERTQATGHVHSVFGDGVSVELREKGRRISFARYPKTPFTLIQGQVGNTTAETTNTRMLEVVTLPVDLGGPADSLRVLGTGGLSECASAPGSYMWIAVAEPKSRRGVVVGWLSSNRGSGVLIPRVINNAVVISARLEFGDLRLSPGQEESLETLVVGRFDDVRLGLEAYANAAGLQNGVRLGSPPCGYCTWYHAGSSNARRISGSALHRTLDHLGSPSCRSMTAGKRASRRTDRVKTSHPIGKTGPIERACEKRRWISPANL